MQLSTIPPQNYTNTYVSEGLRNNKPLSPLHIALLLLGTTINRLRPSPQYRIKQSLMFLVLLII